MKQRILFLMILIFSGPQVIQAQIVSPGVMIPAFYGDIKASGPYFGQPSPGSVIQRFASSKIPEGAWGISFSPDGLECFITQTKNSVNTLYYAKDTAGGWSDLSVAGFSGTYTDMESVITPDGKKLYFGSLRPLAGYPSDILYQWYTDKTDSGWSEPRPMDPPLKGIFMMYPSVAANGNMYYSGWESTGRQWIALSRFVDGQYQEPVEMDDSVNSVPWPAHPFIAPDESYLLFDAVTDTTNWARDLYICFRKPDSSWSRPINLGTKFNNAVYTMFPFVTRDGKYFFFNKDNKLMWVETGFIDKLKPRYGDWLGETPPDTIPKVFAKEFISPAPNQAYSCTFSPDGNEFYYSNLTSSGNNIWKTERINNIWTTPALAPFLQSTWTIEPNFSPDGNTLFFVSDMHNPPPGPPYNPALRIWSMEKTTSGWNAPVLLQGPFSGTHKMFPTVALNRNLYFTDIINDQTRICKSEWLFGGGYQEPVTLDSNINGFASQAHPYIAPDESYLIFDASPEGPPEWKTCLYISFRNNDGTWKKAQKLPDLINATGGEYCGYVSPDQHYLFFARNNVGGGTELWWVKADQILHPLGISEQKKETTRPELYQNFPNPANETTCIRYSLKTRDQVCIKLYDPYGRLEVPILNELRDPGDYSFHFDPTLLPEGIYFYSLSAGPYIITRKLIKSE